MNIKKFYLTILLTLRKNPILASFILTIGGAILYFCGHLLIASSLLGDNFDLIEFILDPLPIPYGHIIAAGSFILALISISIFLATYSVFLIENKEYMKTFGLILASFAFVFLISNFYSLSTGSQLNYNGIIALVLIMLLCALIITFVYAALNLFLGLSVFFYGWNIFLMVSMYIPIVQSVYAGILLATILFFLFWLIFLCIYFLKRQRKSRAIIGILAFPYCLTLALIIVVLPNIIFNIPTAINVISITLLTIALSFLSLKLIKSNKVYLPFRTIFEEIRETGNNVNVLLASSLVTLILMLLLPSLVIYSGKAFNEFSNTHPSHTIVTESEDVEGRYLGHNNGLHYYIEDNKLFRIKDVENILPK